MQNQGRSGDNTFSDYTRGPERFSRASTSRPLKEVPRTPGVSNAGGTQAVYETINRAIGNEKIFGYSSRRPSDIHDQEEEKVESRIRTKEEIIDDIGKEKYKELLIKAMDTKREKYVNYAESDKKYKKPQRLLKQVMNSLTPYSDKERIDAENMISRAYDRAQQRKAKDALLNKKQAYAEAIEQGDYLFEGIPINASDRETYSTLKEKYEKSLEKSLNSEEDRELYLEHKQNLEDFLERAFGGNNEAQQMQTIDGNLTPETSTSERAEKREYGEAIKRGDTEFRGKTITEVDRELYGIQEELFAQLYPDRYKNEE